MFARLWHLVDPDSPVLMVLAAVVPLTVAAAYVPLRGVAGEATVVLTLILVVLIMALLGGRTPALVAAVVGGLAFDVLHTTPYYTVRMDDPEQMEILLAFLVIAVIVGELGHAAANARSSVREAEYREARVHRVLAIAHSGAADADLIAAVVREIEDECQAHAEYVGRAAAPHAAVDAEGEIRDHHGNLLPPDTVTSYRVDVTHAGMVFGAIVLDRATDTDRSQRLEAAVLAQLLAVALAARAGAAASAEDRDVPRR
jgi:hypothetical protein